MPIFRLLLRFRFNSFNQFIYKGKLLPNHISFEKLGIHPDKDLITIMAVQSGGGGNLKEWFDRMFKDCFELVTLNLGKCLRPRFCFGCGSSLVLGEYLGTNEKQMTIQRLLTLWCDERIEIYCCKCYERKKEEQKIEEILARVPTRLCRECQEHKPPTEFIGQEDYNFHLLEKWSYTQ